jgi:hypothetical protein
MRSYFRRRWYWFIPLAILAAVVFGYVVMALWNALLPGIFNLPKINFWQAVGLLLLIRILFGGMGRHGWHANRHYHGHMREKWEKMTPEERERFYQHLHRHHPWCDRPETEKKDTEQ